MKRSQLLHPSLWLLRAAGCSSILVTLLYSCKDGSGTVGNMAMPPPSLPVITVSMLPATTYQDFTASVQGKRDVEIKPQVDGYLTGIEVDEGAYVHKGQPLFIIDRRPFEEQLNNAKAALVAA